MTARNGAAYLDRLRAHSPELWVGAEKITDVAGHKATSGAAAEIARLYDLQFKNDSMLFAPADGAGNAGVQFLMPRTAEDLELRRVMHKQWADSSLGMMGRSTDFVSAMLVAWNANAEFFGEGADRVRAYYKYVRDNDLFLSHALADPPVDRSKPPSQQPDPYTYLGVKRETPDGIIVSGAKMLATAAPYSDEILVWPFSLRKYASEEKPYAIAFAIPADAPGVRLICREPFGGGNGFDHPLSSRFDEMDAVVVFDDVLVPWERVFINQDYERVNRIWAINSNAFTGVQTSVRLLAKLQFVAGIAKRATEIVKTDQFPQVRDALGEITTYIELTRAAVLAAEAGAQRNDEGVLFPDVRPLYAIRNSGNRWYPRVREVLQQILAGGLLYQPADVSAFGSPIAEDIARFYRGPETNSLDRIAIYKVAADLAVSAFGGRHELYERFYAGDPLFLRINTQFNQYDWSEPLGLIDGLLATSIGQAGVLPGGTGEDAAA
ncbi:pyoverdine biosynthesis protein PvcC [Amycolatopsis acidiphila]|uniref:Pyoverdine biosynthesis protein PvcC n=1 Tax=Amycolatopsis acidiphila TaxID=715473 RepID=A0A558AIH9_9PSEU|nr:4-hydroxyphenylacetate 3-hydroxylase N-terminal domain-containing protein [Amycolatopsis acidiphila]TVT24067.1 pyoverdine biosynthesis protein PvcC [Amycolatopsis acidiphila]UIJ57784.1 pyoverdine biosynthesis protein PvcC [Amycolatopsis acidiphila]GHG87681.1 4-hydroxyphenylacetate 3-monooxygenase oxygenase component [Amycolatopsis acidiphila]